MVKKKLKIAFLSRYQDSVARGVETYVSELTKRLSKNHDINIFSGKESDTVKNFLNQNFDIIFPTNGRFQSLKTSLSRTIHKSKIIISGQSGIGRDDIWNILLVRPHVYVALTDAELSWANKYSRGIHLTKIPNGVDLTKFKPVGKKYKTQLKKPIVLSVGALEWYKHHEKTIKALSLDKNFSLLIVGSGSEKDKLTSMGKYFLGDDRFQIIDVPFKEIPDIYRTGDIFTLPSWDREAFGIVYLEALSTNIATVGPNDLSRKEIIGSGGLLVDVDNPKKYLNALKKAYFTNWKDLPRKQAEKFSWDSVANKYEDLFEKLLK